MDGTAGKDAQIANSAGNAGVNPSALASASASSNSQDASHSFRHASPTGDGAGSTGDDNAHPHRADSLAGAPGRPDHTLAAPSGVVSGGAVPVSQPDGADGRFNLARAIVAQNARLIDWLTEYKRPLLALLTSAALLLLAAPGRDERVEQYTDTSAGWVP